MKEQTEAEKIAHAHACDGVIVLMQTEGKTRVQVHGEWSAETIMRIGAVVRPPAKPRKVKTTEATPELPSQP
jgi:hypothetical protein